ncbi:bifunctional histidinol-phosphatase/imidazoleglycerol-phosphate dehydratase HisB [Blochmannia endosymbiont of Polyrhachis (Hedomyrma) turneri]|uniref:bifunctional histidinol-phosphatase/imidazoleglycerol-phosphate dehydratase HisB n=1 Tax=Blochmannia endosymbiont of Polyrhachis (Hedomyrma) turneri TaxID=1505596 RepID=UPI00061A563E|nr:bifunctional histidinol-phosphatase/imidazoleglycerol-phosphate dehydratase HisB [Blochmannia endosymbiont of Polyrhachis (Hedomyrma) turneri]AKC60027.1 histidine biosynthesis bifunctional protein hisB [Blochmannia endosymbiont of Polyrhachis (Hedomyrma) turneri]
MNQKFLFIDRDGTLIHEPTDNFQIDSIDKLTLEPYVIPALLKLQKIGFKLIIITNQDNLGSDHFPQENFDKPHNFMIKIFGSQGIKFNKILICPHSDQDQCYCRKPKIGLVKELLDKNIINKSKSYVIGDRKTDILLAQNMKIQSIQYHRKKCNWKTIEKKLTTIIRSVNVKRITKETTINVSIQIDNNPNNSSINTGIHFFNHMIQQIATHSGIYMNITVKNDIHIDDHHTIEDTALTLGKALHKALGNKKNIKRFGFVLPMDESLAQCSLDLSGRPHLEYHANFNFQKVGDLSTEMIKHFFQSLTQSMQCTLHIKTQGENDHHRAESLFKVFGQSLRQAICLNPNNNNNCDIIPSSKGQL